MACVAAINWVDAVERLAAYKPATMITNKINTSGLWLPPRPTTNVNKGFSPSFGETSTTNAHAISASIPQLRAVNSTLNTQSLSNDRCILGPRNSLPNRHIRQKRRDVDHENPS